MSENGTGSLTNAAETVTTLATVKAAPPPPVPIDKGVMRPNTLEGLWRLAQFIGKSGLVPKGCKSNEQVFVAVAAGLEVGLTPMQSVQNIMVVHGTPTIWGDAGLGLVLASGLCEDFEETFELDGKGAVVAALCRARRKGIASESRWRFTVEDAKAAGLLGNNTYQKYLKRMLQMRARGFCLRNLFADVLKGLRFVEEMDDPEPSVAEAITARLAPKAQAHAEPIVGTFVDPAEPAAAADNGGSSDQPEPDAGGDEPMLTTRGEQGGLPGIDMSGAAASMRGKR